MEAGTSVRLSFQSCSLLLLADESSGVTVRMKLFRDFNLLAAGWWWNSWCLSSVVWRVRSIRQATVLLMCGGAIPASKCTLSKFVGLRQPEMIRQQSCRAGFSLPTQGRRILQLSSRGRDSWVWVSMPCTPTSSSRVYGWCYFSRSPSSLSSRCAFYSTEFGQGGCPGTLLLLYLRVWYRSTLHSVLVWLLDSVGGRHIHWGTRPCRILKVRAFPEVPCTYLQV